VLRLLVSCPGPGPVQPVIPDRPGTVVHVAKIFQALMLVYVIFLALFVKWLKPSFWGLSSSILLGAVLGLAYSLWHAWNKKQREDIRGLVRAPLYEAACNCVSRACVQEHSLLCFLEQAPAVIAPLFDVMKLRHSRS
jgi:hypothetical protein